MNQPPSTKWISQTLLRQLAVFVSACLVVAVLQVPAAVGQIEEAEDVRLKEMVELQTALKQVIKVATPAVVAIESSGSGVVVSAEGIVLTASHVAKDANRVVKVKFYDGRIVLGVTLGANYNTDTAAIRLLDSGPYAFLPVENRSDGTDAAPPGVWCVSMGYPLSFPRGKPAVARLGRVLRISDSNKMVSDCTIMGGDSGGPLLDLQGRIIGISSSVKLDIEENLYIPARRYLEDWQHLTFSIENTGQSQGITDNRKASLPMEAKLNMEANLRMETFANLNRVATKTKVRTQSRGGSTVPIKRAAKAYLGVSAESDGGRVRIRQVHPGSPAQSAGLQAEDVVVSIDNDPLKNFGQLVKKLRTCLPGQDVRVKINRFGALLELPVILGNGR